MTDARIALTTCSDADAAAKLAAALVESRVAACVNIVPGIRSIYRWQGAVEDDAECLLVIKTVAERVGDLRDSISRLHPYDVPELLVLAVESGAQSSNASSIGCRTATKKSSSSPRTRSSTPSRTCTRTALRSGCGSRCCRAMGRQKRDRTTLRRCWSTSCTWARSDTSTSF